MKRLTLLTVVLALYASVATAQNLVFNDTGKSHVEQMVRAGMDSLQIDQIMIFIFDEKSSFGGNGMTENKIYGYVIKGSMYYIITINFELTTKQRLPNVIAHELIHIHQHETKRLIDVNDSISVWKGKVYNRNKIEYNKYPWEIEAFKYQRSLAKAIKQ